MPVLRSVATLACVVALAGAASAGYIVRPGDTLTAIARRAGTTIAELVRANGISDPDRIRVGERLTLPSGPAHPPSARPARLHTAPARAALEPRFRHWAAANGIPADLLMAMTWYESGWQNDKVSSAGARGIGQLMPSTVVFVRQHLIGVADLDPRVAEDNIRMSARFLRWQLERAGGDVRLALAGYYQGHRSVELRGVLPVTEAYVRGVLALRPRFA